MADGLDFAFVPPSVPVFAHPLLRNIKSPKSNSNNSAVKTGSTSAENGGSSTEPSEKFFDPLGASSSLHQDGVIIGRLGADFTKKNEAKSRLTKKNGIVEDDSKLDGLEEIAGRILSNTLKEDDPEEELDLDPQLLGFKPWKELKAEILKTFTTKDRLCLESSFLNDGRADRVPEKRRILLGETSTNVFKFQNLTQEDYVKKLGDLRKILVFKWKQERRIECIRLVVEVARLLAGVPEVPNFYPAQFVHVTDLLDHFGHLVYERLTRRADRERQNAGLESLPNRFSIHDILEQTRITARNWFGKINEIRELVPRIYVECALLKCMRFMDPSALAANVMRLCALAKSVAHPLTSSYLRCYICRVAIRLDVADRAPGWKCLNDWMQTYTQQPAFLLWPAMQYVVQCVSYNAVTYDDLSPLWEYCRIVEKRPVILCPMLNGVSNVYLAANALEACRIITGSDLVTGEELCALGANLLRAEMSEADRKPVLKSVWKCVGRLSGLKSYVECCDVWVEFVVRYFSANELQIVLEHVLRKLQPDKKYELYYEHMVSMLRKILLNADHLPAVLNIDAFHQFIDLFREEGVKSKAASLILNAVIARHPIGAFTDFNLAYQVKGVCKQLNDTLNVFSPPAHVDVASAVIRLSLDRFDLLADPEQALSFYVACRAGLLNNNQLQKYVVVRIMSVALHVVRTVRFTISRSAFLQACMANLFITIPSLYDPLDRLQLGVQSAQLALAALSFLQVDEFVRLCLETFDELVEQSSSSASTTALSLAFVQRLRTTCAYFLSFLLTVPSSASSLSANHHGGVGVEGGTTTTEPLAIFGDFYATIKRYEFPAHMSVEQARLLLDCVRYLFARLRLAQPVNLVGQPSAEQFQWTQMTAAADGPRSAIAERQRAYQHLLDIGNRLAERLLSVDGKPSATSKPQLDVRLDVSMELVELVAAFDDQEWLPESIQSVSREAVRRCKRSGNPDILRRVKLLRMGGR